MRSRQQRPEGAKMLLTVATPLIATQFHASFHPCRSIRNFLKPVTATSTLELVNQSVHLRAISRSHERIQTFYASWNLLQERANDLPHVGIVMKLPTKGTFLGRSCTLDWVLDHGMKVG